jgi:hypothetical protein
MGINSRDPTTAMTALQQAVTSVRVVMRMRMRCDQGTHLPGNLLWTSLGPPPWIAAVVPGVCHPPGHLACLAYEHSVDLPQLSTFLPTQLPRPARLPVCTKLLLPAGGIAHAAGYHMHPTNMSAQEMLRCVTAHSGRLREVCHNLQNKGTKKCLGLMKGLWSCCLMLQQKSALIES